VDPFPEPSVDPFLNRLDTPIPGLTMNGLVAAALQFCADCRFASAGNAFDQIVFDAHFLAF
jgi:hypothetical protein